MTNIASTIPGTKAALVALLLQPLAPASVSYGKPRETAKEAVWFGGVSDVAQDVLTMPATAVGSRLEEYHLDGIVHVSHKVGQSEQQATERAFALLALIQDTIRPNPSLNVAAGVHLGEIALTSYQPHPSNDGCEVTLEFAIHVVGQI